ncbi:trafficking protein particle complex subunit 10 [Microdochium trichocladiopsis]|uniref:Trafficking protein particle complex subunit 10 n=1 Tax=Microdochium trichocladiopsis TaxID=1682393 RepID=A0A9P9BN65_9PEZI|nr:trafficking protein particle complex subunit 10 [Microdochium trichocladiopsis]KAH7027386.1 trafficking protein particle complex subunit 10 [Microdochium trichocladiopsis]
MEQTFSTSKVNVEYFDPHDVYKLLAPGLVPRLPLRNLHWQSHAGPLRSIDTLHIELTANSDSAEASVTSPANPNPPRLERTDSFGPSDDGFQTQIGTSPSAATSAETKSAPKRLSVPIRRHQIPGLRRTPYLKVLLVRCDDNDSYKTKVRAEVREWIKNNTPPTSSSKKANAAENHDAFEWLIVHVVIPNTVAATQPRKSSSESGSEKSSTSRWRPGSSTLLEKFRSDFNSSSKSSVDRIAQIRIGVNDVPYDSLPRVVPAPPSGYTESEQESRAAWEDLLTKFRSLILSSFDSRVSQYEEDIKERDGQRSLPGWNFCTFFILKEGLARGFESVGLVEDALVGYDELSVGLDVVVNELALGDSRSTANALPTYTEELKKIAQKARAAMAGSDLQFEEETVDLQSGQSASSEMKSELDEIPVSSSKKPYREMILANNVSIFDFRCYIFARQVSLLLRLANAWSTREELLAKLKEQQESVLLGVAPRLPPPKQKESEHEVLLMLAEICRRTLEFIPAVSQVMRRDILAALAQISKEDGAEAAVSDPVVNEVIDNMVASFGFNVAQQILAQSATKALPIPPSSLTPSNAQEPKSTIPEPKTMMHPARGSSLRVRTGPTSVRPPSSPDALPGPHTSVPDDDPATNNFIKAGLEELAARRAELYALSRNILEESGKKRGWDSGWATVPVIGESTMVDMVEIDLADDDTVASPKSGGRSTPYTSIHGVDSKLLSTGLDNKDDFYRLYETLTDKTLRHYTVANHDHSVQANMADLAVLKYHLQEYNVASAYFWRATPFFGESGWTLLELSMLVMYTDCLKRLGRKDEYVKVMLKLLSKAASAERERLESKAVLHIAPRKVEYPDTDVIKGFLPDLQAEVKELSKDTLMPLSSFFAKLEVAGIDYHDGRDGVTLKLDLQSLLADSLELTKARVRVASKSSGMRQEIWFESSGMNVIEPGKTTLRLDSNVCIPGSYEVDRVELLADKLCLFHDRSLGQSPKAPGELLTSPQVALYHRAEALDVRLSASQHIQLDRNNTVDIDLESGWNEIVSAEIRVKAATGGLRILTSEAKCMDDSIEFSRSSESGCFQYGAVPAGTTVKVRFPYTVEHEVLHVAVRIEVSYKTAHGEYSFSKSPSVPVSLALGVNVQDIFKHNALFSRFTVSTASQSPIRVYEADLQKCELFDSDFGLPPQDPIVIFPKQPASLLYKIKRRAGVKIDAKVTKTMYLKLAYSVLQDDVEQVLAESIQAELKGTPLSTYSRLLTTTVIPHMHQGMSSHDLERASLLGRVSTTPLASVNWAQLFTGLGKDSNGDSIAALLATFLAKWQKSHPSLALPGGKLDDPRTILIPVDIPPVTIVHTTDIQLLPATVDPDAPICTNQLVPANLHLKWTRAWDTATPPQNQSDLEFSYEVMAPGDSWLLGGRKKGHFVIPAPVPRSSGGGADGGNVDEYDGLTSTLETEADIPLLLIPLREGWLPYPNVEIREIRGGSSAAGGGSGSTDSDGGAGGAGDFVAIETDYRNLGETVRVVADRTQVTLSLDAGGPGGGPLVLDVERREVEGRQIVG